MRKFFTALSVTIGLLLTSVPAFAQAPEKECITFEQTKENLIPGVEIVSDWSGAEARTVRQIIAKKAEVAEEDIVPFDRVVVLLKEDLPVAMAVVFSENCRVFFGPLSFEEYHSLQTELRTANAR